MLRKSLYTIFGSVSLVLFCIILSAVDIEPGGWWMFLGLIAIASLCGVIAALLYDPHIVVSRLFAWAMINLYFLQVMLNTRNELMVAAYRLRKQNVSLSLMYYAIIDFYMDYIEELSEDSRNSKVVFMNSAKVVK